MLKFSTSLTLAMGLALTAPMTAAMAQEAGAQQGADWLDIELNKSIVIETPRVPRAISITNPDIADVVQLGSPTKWQIQGAAIGSTDLVIQFGGDEPPLIYEITVHQDLSDMIRRVEGLAPENPPRVYPLNGRIVVEGSVPDLDTLERVAMVARMYDEEFVNLMQVGGDHQVQLEVIYAEVSRTGLRRMGINVLWSLPQAGAGLLNNLSTLPQSGLGSVTNLQPFALDAGYNALGYVAQGINIIGVMNLLDSHNLGKVIAQPTLVSLSGQKAEFLNGGQIPIVVPNPQGFATAQFRDYGTRMLFIPTVLSGDVIDVQVDLELSDLDTANGVNLSGAIIPALTTRRARAHVRLKSGMTFAIAGLLSETTTFARDGVPGLSRIPILGAFFREIEHRREEIEIMVYVTPRLVRPMAEDEVPPILGSTEDNNPGDLKFYLLGMDRKDRSRTAEPTGPIGLHR